METLEHNTAESASSAPRWKGLGTRAASAAVLAAVFIGLLIWGGWPFTWIVVVAALIMIKEWNGLTENQGPIWRSAGLVYVSVPCASLIWLRNVHFATNGNAGMQLVLFVMLIVWATDIGAYFTGRQVGGPKLAPKISPNKTWAGLGGGIGAAALAGGLSFLFVPYPTNVFFAILLGAVMAIIAQAGDLLESWMKRRVGVKDSGSLIPGHGGILDRIDGLIFPLPLFALIVYLSGLVI